MTPEEIKKKVESEAIAAVENALAKGKFTYPESYCELYEQGAYFVFNLLAASQFPSQGLREEDLEPEVPNHDLASVASHSSTVGNSIEHDEPFWQGQEYIQSGELLKAEQLFEDNGLKLELTCPACPEQYDVYKKVGYLRLRHGEFRVDFPDCGDETIYEAEPRGDGIFEGGERMKYLTEAMNAILKKLNSVWNDERSVATGDAQSDEAGNPKDSKTSTPDGSHGLREALERIKELSDDYPGYNPDVIKINAIATEALKK